MLLARLWQGRLPPQFAASQCCIQVCCSLLPAPQLLPPLPAALADASSGKPVLLGSGHFANVYRGVYGAEPAAIKVRWGANKRSG